MSTELIRENDFFASNLPDLEKAKVAPLELTGEYWSPKKEGEKRRMFFKEIRIELSKDMTSGEDIDLAVAYFVEVQKNGDKKIVRQAGRRLVGVIENFKLASGTPLEITYLGKEKNKNNQFSSDTWSVKPLHINQ